MWLDERMQTLSARNQCPRDGHPPVGIVQFTLAGGEVPERLAAGRLRVVIADARRAVGRIDQDRPLWSRSCAARTRARPPSHPADRIGTCVESSASTQLRPTPAGRLASRRPVRPDDEGRRRPPPFRRVACRRRRRAVELREPPPGRGTGRGSQSSIEHAASEFLSTDVDGRFSSRLVAYVTCGHVRPDVLRADASSLFAMRWMSTTDSAAAKLTHPATPKLTHLGLQFQTRQ